MNIVNGGAHADNRHRLPGIHDHAGGRQTFAEGLRMGTEVFHALKAQLKQAGHNTNVGDEGGFAPNLKAADQVLAFVMKAIESGRLSPGEQWRWRSTRLERVLQERQVRHGGEGKTLDCRRHGEVLPGPGGRAIRS
jgi:enolase